MSHRRNMHGKESLYRQRCGKTKKVCYRSHDAALVAACDIMAKPDCDARQFRAYHCLNCGFFHLTTHD